MEYVLIAASESAWYAFPPTPPQHYFPLRSAVFTPPPFIRRVPAAPAGPRSLQGLTREKLCCPTADDTWLGCCPSGEGVPEVRTLTRLTKTLEYHKMAFAGFLWPYHM